MKRIHKKQTDLNQLARLMEMLGSEPQEINQATLTLFNERKFNLTVFGGVMLEFVCNDSQIYFSETIEGENYHVHHCAAECGNSWRCFVIACTGEEELCDDCDDDGENCPGCDDIHEEHTGDEKCAIGNYRKGEN